MNHFSEFIFRCFKKPLKKVSSCALWPAENQGKKPFLRLENLESRLCPAVNFQFTLDSANGGFGAFPGVLVNLQEAAKLFSGFLDGNATIEVLVNVENSRPTASAAAKAAFDTGRISADGRSIFEDGTLREIRTGADPNGSTEDIDIYVNTATYLPVSYPAGAQGFDVNLTAVFVHELFHGFGINGYRDVDSKQFPSSVKSVFDELTAFGSGSDSSVLFFNGSAAKAAYGKPIPLPSLAPEKPGDPDGRWYHLGNRSGTGFDPILLNDVMEGPVYFPVFTQKDLIISEIDIAIMKDLGYKVNPRPRFTTSASTSFEAGKAGAFQFAVTGASAPTFSIASGLLPAGVVLTSNGILSGTPKIGSGGEYLITVKASSVATGPVTQVFTLKVLEGPKFTTSSKATFAYGAADTFRVSATGYPAPTFYIDSPQPPGGLAINAVTGVLSGKPYAGVYTFKVFAKNSLNSGLFQTFTLTVSKAALIIKAESKSKVYGAALPAFSATYTGLVNGDKSSVVSGLVLSTVAKNSSGVGTYKITASKGLAANYAITFVDAVLTVTKAPLTIKAENKNKVYGAALPAFSATYAGLVNGDKSSVVSGLVLSTVATLSSQVGNYKITPSKGSAANYAISFAEGILGVVKAPLKIIAANKSRLFGQANPALTVSFAGLVKGDTPNSVTGLRISTSATQSSKGGEYPITLSGATAANYVITLVNGILTINQPAMFTSKSSASFPSGKMGSFQFTVSGFPNAVFSVSNGSLPTGVTLNATTGRLTIQSTVRPGTYIFTIKANNGIGTAPVQSFTLTIA